MQLHLFLPVFIVSTIHFVHRSNLRFQSDDTWYEFYLLACEHLDCCHQKCLAHDSNHPRKERHHCLFMTQLHTYLKDTLLAWARLTVMLATFFHYAQHKMHVIG